LCPSAPEKAPEKERLTTWEPSLKNDDAKWLEEIENE
jgi:hypothetical protein